MLWSRADGLSQMNLFYVLCQRHVCGETLLENKSILSSNMKTRGIIMTIIRFPHINIIIQFEDMKEKYRVVFLTGAPDFQYQKEKQVAANQY